MTKRVIALVTGIGLVGLSTILDPYTWFLNASDLVIRAPFWQSVAGFIGALILVSAAVQAARRRGKWVVPLLVAELSFSIAMNLLYLNRDGLARFSRGFGGEEYLSPYLVLLMLRVWLVALACAEYRLGIDREVRPTSGHSE